MAAPVGLIGGIGPAATVVYYRALVQLHAAAGHPLALTIAHADLGALVASLEVGRAAALKAGCCDLVAVTSMAGHVLQTWAAERATDEPQRNCSRLLKYSSGRP